MKLAFVGLTVFGLFAGLSAAVLVNIWRRQLAPNAMQDTTAEIQVLSASKDLPAGSVVDAGCLSTKQVPRKEAPAGYLANPIQVVGKILSAPMVKDQAFTPVCFATEGSGFHVVSALKDGMRAVSIALADHAGLEGLLYPGSIVDVLVSFKAPSTDGGSAQPMTVTLLYAVRVLAVEKQTIVSAGKEAATAEVARGGSNRHMVTLAVEPKQAEALQLAQEFGTVSLTMRNPMDRTIPKADGVVLSELAEGNFKRLLRARDLALTPLASADPAVVGQPVTPRMGDGVPHELAPADIAKAPEPAQPQPETDSVVSPPPPPGFTTTVINGLLDGTEVGRILRVTYRDSNSTDIINIQAVESGHGGGWFGTRPPDKRAASNEAKAANERRLAGAESGK